VLQSAKTCLELFSRHMLEWVLPSLYMIFYESKNCNSWASWHDCFLSFKTRRLEFNEW
jgi:hypothetical protein